MEESVLESLGLDKCEVKVYLALLQLGESPVLEISRKAKTERMRTYRILESLTDKGLVSFVTENKTKKFKAANPDELFNQLEEKKAALKEVLPKLKRMLELKEKKEQSVEVFRGTKGAKALINEILETKKDFYTLGPDFRPHSLDFFLTHFMKTLEKENIHEKELIKKRGDIISSKNTTMRFLPEKYSYLATTMIYGDMVGIVVCSEPFLAIRIKSKEVAETYKNYFEIIWEVSKK